MKFIGDEGNPQTNLKRYLTEESSFMYHDLDQLYLRVVSSPNATYGLKLMRVIVLLAAPLSVRELRRLLPWQVGDIEVALRSFSSVLFVPKDTDEQLRIYHSSFRDFLIDPERSQTYSIDVPICHRDIATFCLDFLVKTLRRDICCIGDPSKLNDEVEDLEVRRHENINAALSYCCRYWAIHISSSRMDSRLQDSLSAFMKKSLLYWLETLSLLGELDTAVSSLQAASIWYKEQRTFATDDNLLRLLNDAERFTLRNFDGIHDSALHIYYSALLFTPEDVPLREIYKDELKDAFITISCGLEKRWSPCSRVITLKSNVESIALSEPDGNHCISASEKDGVKLWNTVTGLNTITYHCSGLHARLAIFTRDSTRIAAGYEDGTIGVWDATSGRPMVDKKLHDGKIMCLAFSSSGSFLASASATTIWLWDIPNGQAWGKLSGHKKAVTCVVFSPNLDRELHVLSADEEGIIRLWNVHTIDLELTMAGHEGSVASVAFSPNGACVASGSVDRTIRVWNAATGQCLMMLKGHRDAVSSVVFSQEGSQIVSSSNDGTIRCWNSSIQQAPTYIWNTPYSLVERFFIEVSDVDWRFKWICKLGFGKPGWESFCLFGKEPNHPLTIGFSPTTLPFAFEVYDCVFISSNLTPHNDPLVFISNGTVSALAISSDGRTLASCTQNTIRLWDSSLRHKTWQEFNTAFRGHVMKMLAVSPNGKYMAIMCMLGYALVDYTGRVLCVLDTVLTIGFRPYIGYITTQATFTPDSSTLAYWHESKSEVKLFSTTSGRCTRTLTFGTQAFRGQGNAVSSVAFSPDSTFVACGYEGGAIRISDVKTGCTVSVLNGHHQRITSIKFSCDGLDVVSCSSDHSIRRWTSSNGEFANSLELEQESIAAIFAPDNSCIVYAANSHSISVWDTALDSKIHSFASVEDLDIILSLGFSNDGTRLFCRTNNSLTYVWDFPHMEATQRMEQEEFMRRGPVQVPLLFGHHDCFCDYGMFSQYILRGGWIFNGEKRLCWVPNSLRPRRDEDFRGIENGVLMRTNNNDKIVILHFGKMPTEY